VDKGAPSVAPSAHANCADASGEVDVLDEATHAAGGVVASDWPGLAATLGDGAVAAGATGVCKSANDDAQSHNDNDEPASVLEAILGRQVGHREDTACDEDKVGISVGVDVDAVVGVSVHGQAMISI